MNPAPIIKETITVPRAHAQVIEEIVPLVKAPELPLESTIEGNCYLYVRSKIKDLPSTKDIIPNSIYPNVGGVTVINYDGLRHYMLNEQVTEEGLRISECNFVKGKCGERLLTWEYLIEKKAQYYRLEGSD